MPRVFIPAPMRPLTGGESVVDAVGETVGQVIDDLESRFPGVRDRLCDDGGLKSSFSVAVNGKVRPKRLRAAVEADSEVHFLPAIGGG